MCLLRWFTSVQGDGNANANPVTEPDDVTRLLNSQPAVRGVFLRNRKTCPLCRAAIVERPAEIWSIKSMVANVIKSKLVELPSVPPPSATETPSGDGAGARMNHQNDPWRNVFPKPRSGGFHHHQHQFYPPPPENNEAGEGGWNVEDMGMYDAEDGGIYRCLECMHEIWGGVCTNCDREYPGHARFDDDDDDGDFSEDGSDGENFLGRRLREIWGEYVQDNPRMGWGPDDGDEDEGEGDGVWYGAIRDQMDLTDESMSDEHSDLDNGEDGFISESDGEDDESERSWSSDEGGDHDNPLLDHQRDMVNMMHDDPYWPFGPRLLRREPGAARIEEVEEEEDEDEDDVSHSDDDSHSHPGSVEDEEAYEDSFIDDDEEDGPQGYHLRSHNHNRRQRNRFEALEVSDDDEPPINLDEDDGVDHRALARRLGRGMRMGAGTPPPPPIPGPERRRRRRESPIVVDGEDGDDHGVGSRVRRRGVGRAGRRRRIVHEEPSEDEVDIVVDDEGEVRPAGRRQRNARQRVRVFIDENSE